MGDAKSQLGCMDGWKCGSSLVELFDSCIYGLSIGV